MPHNVRSEFGKVSQMIIYKLCISFWVLKNSNCTKLEIIRMRKYNTRSLSIYSNIANLLAKALCWNFPKRGGDGASQRERGGGGEREEKTPAGKYCENEKHPLIRRAWPLFRKWVADNNKTTKQSLQSKDSHCLKKNKLEFIIVFILTESQCNSPQLMKLQFNLQFILLHSSLQIAIRESLTSCKQF